MTGHPEIGVTDNGDVLDLFLNPLLALLILFLECVTLDFGTAKTIGGRSSSKDARPGIAKYHGLGWVADAKEESMRAESDRVVEGLKGRRGM